MAPSLQDHDCKPEKLTLRKFFLSWMNTLLRGPFLSIMRLAMMASKKGQNEGNAQAA